MTFQHQNEDFINQMGYLNNEINNEDVEESSFSNSESEDSSSS